MEREGKSVHTSIHVRHFPDLPCGDITIEVTSITKHCTTPTAKKSPTIKKKGIEKKKRGEQCSKNRISAASERRKEKEKQPKKDPILERVRKECTY